MSASNSAAKKRRAPIEQPKPTYVSPNASIQQQVTTSTSPSGLTLPQVIALIDKRLVSLEGFTTEFKNSRDEEQFTNSNSIDNDSLQELSNEMDSRFEVFVEEFANLKNIVMSLQNYTMDVNKMLLEERSLQSQKNNAPKRGVPDDTVVIDYSAVVDFSNVAPKQMPVLVLPTVTFDSHVENTTDKITIEKVITDKNKKGSRISV